jgi:hypothetical protein
VDEHVFAALLGDEAVPLRVVVEPHVGRAKKNAAEPEAPAALSSSLAA